MQIDRLFAQTQRRLDARDAAAAKRQAERARAMDGAATAAGSGSWANRWRTPGAPAGTRKRPSLVRRAVMRLRPAADRRDG